MSEAIFYSRHRKCTCDIANPDVPGGREIIRFKSHGSIGAFRANERQAKELRAHPKYMVGTRGGFYETKPKAQEVNNVVQGTKGAGTVKVVKEDPIPAPSDEVNVVKAPVKRTVKKKAPAKRKKK